MRGFANRRSQPTATMSGRPVGTGPTEQVRKRRYRCPSVSFTPLVKLDFRKARVVVAVGVGIASVGLAGFASPVRGAGSGPSDGSELKLPSVSTPPDPGLPVGVAFANPELGFVASDTGRPMGAASGVVMAASGIISRTTDSGLVWQPVWQQPGISLGWLGISGNMVIATGYEYPTSGVGSPSGSPVLLLGGESGQSWRLIHPSLPASDATWQITWGFDAVQWVSPSLALATPAPDAVGSIPPTLLISRDGGSDWTEVNLPGGTSSGGVSVVSATEIFATGSPATPTSECQGAVWETTDQGLNWAMLPGSCSVAPLLSVQFLNQQVGFTGGGLPAAAQEPPGMVLLETADGGANWSVQSEGYSSTNGPLPVVQIEFTTPDLGAVLSGGCTPGAVMPCPGQVYTTDDGGLTFRRTTGAGSDLATAGSQAMWVLNSQAGVVLASSDRGSHWSTVPGVGQLGIEGLSFQSGALIVFTPLGALASANGARTWKFLSSTPDVGSLGYSPPRVEAIYGDSVLASSEGSNSVETRTYFPKAGAYGLSSIAFTTSERGILLGEGSQCLKPHFHPQSAAVFVTGDGGRQWHHVSDLPLANSQVAYSGTFVVVVGEEGCHSRLATSADGGLQWTIRLLPRGTTNCVDPSLTDSGAFWLTCTTTGIDGVTYLATGSVGSSRFADHKLAGLSLQSLFAVSAHGELYALGTERGANIIWTSHNGGSTWRGVVLTLPSS
jgi:hypothetical protein